jgi:hypothetical protein
MEQHLNNAVKLVRTMMASASSDRIRRVDWWARAKSALETAAMSSDNFSSMISSMARKLQIDVTSTQTGEEVADLALAVENDFESFRRFCEREAVYVVAIAQAEAKARREKYEKAAAETGVGTLNFDTAITEE